MIDALNRDMPFDQFLVEQIAGDLLPNGTVEQKVATGFQRNAVTNREDGIDVEQYRNEKLIDRTATFGTAYLGLTVGCAQCHDHKYDPLTQREFYQLLAFFTNARKWMWKPLCLANGGHTWRRFRSTVKNAMLCWPSITSTNSNRRGNRG